MIKPKKSLGQNFLIDNNILNKIIKLTKINSCNVVEIGPGTGNLTKKIIEQKPKSLFLIEKDQLLSNNLSNLFEKTNNIKIFNEDILKFNLEEKLKKDTIIIGNLPYNISSQILIKLIKFDNIPNSLMMSVCEKWCCPQWIIDLLNKEEIKTKNNKLDIHDYFLKCLTCNVGFKMSENTSTSCKTHKSNYSSITNNFPCCGNNPNEVENHFCRVGYHTPTPGSMNDYPLYLKNIN